MVGNACINSDKKLLIGKKKEEFLIKLDEMIKLVKNNSYHCIVPCHKDSSSIALKLKNYNLNPVTFSPRFKMNVDSTIGNSIGRGFDSIMFSPIEMC